MQLIWTLHSASFARQRKCRYEGQFPPFSHVFCDKWSASTWCFHFFLKVCDLLRSVKTDLKLTFAACLYPLCNISIWCYSSLNGAALGPRKNKWAYQWTQIWVDIRTAVGSSAVGSWPHSLFWSECQAAFAQPVRQTLAQTDFISGQHLLKSAGAINLTQDTQTNMVTHNLLNGSLHGKQLTKRTQRTTSLTALRME